MASDESSRPAWRQPARDSAARARRARRRSVSSSQSPLFCCRRRATDDRPSAISTSVARAFCDTRRVGLRPSCSARTRGCTTPRTRARRHRRRRRGRRRPASGSAGGRAWGSGSPFSRAASKIVVPFGTSTSRPSIVSLIRSAIRRATPIRTSTRRLDSVVQRDAPRPRHGSASAPTESAPARPGRGRRWMSSFSA